MARFEFIIILLVGGVLLSKVTSQLSPASESVTLKCLKDQIQVDIKTNGPFSGAIYTQGSFRQNGCYIDAHSETIHQLIFPLNGCQTIQQSSGVYSNVLIVQNEDELITKEDSAFEIQCDYNPRLISLESQNVLEFGKKENINDKKAAKVAPLALASISQGDIYMQGSITKGENLTSVSNGSNVAVLSLKKLPKNHAY